MYFHLIDLKRIEFHLYKLCRILTNTSIDFIILSKPIKIF